MSADPVMDELNKIASELQGQSLLVGFVDGATYTDGTSVAEVAYQNEFGEPIRNQPPRPFFRNAITAHESEWVEQMGKGLRAGYSVNQVLEVMGALIAGDVKLSITQLYDPELSPVTIALRRNEAHRKAIDKPVNTSTKPLVDTGTMLGNVGYEIRSSDESTLDSQ